MVAKSFKSLFDYLLTAMDTFDLSREKKYSLSEFESSVIPASANRNFEWASYQGRPVLTMRLASVSSLENNPPAGFLEKILGGLSGMYDSSPVYISLRDEVSNAVLEFPVAWPDRETADQLKEFSEYGSVLVGGIYQAKVRISDSLPDEIVERSYLLPDSKDMLLLKDVKYLLHFMTLPDYSKTVVMPGVKVTFPSRQ